MKKISYAVLVLLTGVALSRWEGTGSMAYAKTVEAGESNASWKGTGEIYNFGDGEQVISGIVKGVLMARHKDEAKTVVHSSKLTCAVRVNLNRKQDQHTEDGLCTIVAHEGKDIAYAQWKCTGTLKECGGEFTFTGGAGGFAGISGTTPFHTSIVFDLQEKGTGRAVGYAVWPNLTYTLP